MCLLRVNETTCIDIQFNRALTHLIQLMLVSPLFSRRSAACRFWSTRDTTANSTTTAAAEHVNGTEAEQSGSSQQATGTRPSGHVRRERKQVSHIFILGLY